MQDQNLWATNWTAWTVVSGPVIYDTANIELDGEYDSRYNILPGIYVLDAGSPTCLPRDHLWRAPGMITLAGGQW